MTDEQKKYISPATTKKLTTKKKASDWLNNNDSTINKDDITSEDADALEKVLDEYNNLDDDIKDYISEETVEKIVEDIKTASPETKDFINDFVSDGKNDFTSATKDNYKKILEGKDKWNALDETTKNLINSVLKTETGKTYDELLKEAENIEKSTHVVPSDPTNSNNEDNKNKNNGKYQLVNTGDTTNVALYAGLGLIAIIVIGAIMLFRRKHS